jgi:hypothetical protein
MIPFSLYVFGHFMTYQLVDQSSDFEDAQCKIQTEKKDDGALSVMHTDPIHRQMRSLFFG